METRNCQNCKQDFKIPTEDLTFYSKFEVPFPTFCPECRLQRRLMFRNERSLYNHACHLCGKKTLSVISPDKKYKVYCVSCWVSDKWNAAEYGKEYDFTTSFFAQFKELMQEVPIRALATSNSNINSEFTNTSSNLKDCYLIYGCDSCENCMYSSELTESSKDCVDCMMLSGSTSCYNSVNCQRCSTALHCVDCQDSFNISYSRNLSGCSYCFGCSNLSRKSYYIFNEPYTKEEYFKKLEELEDGAYTSHLKNKEAADAFHLKYPKKFFHGVRNNNVSGDYVYNSSNTHNTFIAVGTEDSKYCWNIVMKPAKNCFDYTDWGGNVENMYESQSCGSGVSNIKFCSFVTKNSLNAEYSLQCANCQDIFGCVGLRNKQYYIFNKPYTKEEYFILRDKIIEQMKEVAYTDAQGRTYKYGEFFPYDLSYFSYNETNAQDYFTITEQEARKMGFAWSESRERNYTVDTLYTELPEKSSDATADILSKTISCKNADLADRDWCTKAFRIIGPELAFYQKENIPLPRMCPNCRHHERLTYRNKPKLYARSCMCDVTTHNHTKMCPNTFETTYSPDRPEKVYCEECYQKEVL